MKDYKRVRRRSRVSWWTWLFCLTFFSQTPSVYALPGTSHALISEPSLDVSRQASLSQTVIQNSVSHPDAQPPPSAPDAQPPPSAPDLGSTSFDPELPTKPHCIVVDTDSKMFLINSGANAVIVNDVKLLTDFRASVGGVKGIGGLPIALKGSGQCDVPLHFDDGSSHTCW
jgi:hypothetical protein